METTVQHWPNIAIHPSSKFNLESQSSNRNAERSDNNGSPTNKETHMNNKDELEQFGCCQDIEYLLLDDMENNIPMQAILGSKIFIAGAILHIPSLCWNILYNFNVEFKRSYYGYLQWHALAGGIAGLIFTLFITTSKLSRKYPLNFTFYIIESFIFAHLSAVCTSSVEHGIIDWLLTSHDFENKHAVSKLAEIQSRFPYVPPYIVGLYHGFFMMQLCILSLYLRILKPAYSKDMIFFVVFAVSFLQFYCGIKAVDHGVMPPGGPYGWAHIQIILASVASHFWTMWRLYDMRIIFEGKKFNIGKKDCMFVAINLHI